MPNSSRKERHHLLATFCSVFEKDGGEERKKDFLK